MVTKAQASKASDTVLSQIRSGCHDRQAPWGRKIDIASTPPRKRPARTHRNAVSRRDNGSNQSVFGDPAQAQPLRWLRSWTGRKRLGGAVRRHRKSGHPAYRMRSEIFVAMATKLCDLILLRTRGRANRRRQG